MCICYFTFRSPTLFQPAVLWSGHHRPGRRVAHLHCQHQHVSHVVRCSLFCFACFVHDTDTVPIGITFVCHDRAVCGALETAPQSSSSYEVIVDVAHGVPSQLGSLQPLVTTASEDSYIKCLTRSVGTLCWQTVGRHCGLYIRGRSAPGVVRLHIDLRSQLHGGPVW